MNEGPRPKLDELHDALRLLGERLPGEDIVLYTALRDAPLRRTFIGAGVETLTGYPQAVFRNDPDKWSSIVHAEDRVRMVAVLEVFREGERTLEYRIRTAEGHERWVRDTLRVGPRGEGGDVLIGRLSDGSELRRLKSEASALQERLWRAQRLESVGAMAGGVAHDFNNLLTAILSSAQMLRDQVHSSESRQDLEVIEEAAGRGAALVRQVMTFASRSGQRSGTVSLSNMVRGLEDILGRAMGEDVLLAVHAPDDVWEINGDTSRLEQVLLNLAMNAREAMPDGGTVEIVVSNIELPSDLLAAAGDVLRPGKYARLTVRDTGPGIPAELLDRIFDPFFSTKAQGAGRAGFGLTAVQRVARGYGGAVRVIGADGQGTAFEVYFPVSPAAGEPLQAPPPMEVASGGVRVLVVEDDPAVLGIVERALTRAGHAVVSVGNAAEGLRVFDRVQPPFDLVVSDVILPDRSGPVLVQALRRRVPDLAVVYMSGYGQDALEGEDENQEMTFLHKPFAPSQLLDAVREALEHRRGTVEAGRDSGGELV